MLAYVPFYQYLLDHPAVLYCRYLLLLLFHQVLLGPLVALKYREPPVTLVLLLGQVDHWVPKMSKK